MRNKIQVVLKKLLIFLLCTASLASAVQASIPIAQAAGSYEILGTNTALGSPLLNTQGFSTEDWNPYETIAWGVFLSNFCQPLIDTYESAFRAGIGGSDGYGYAALWGGSGSDASNKEIIKALTDYAIDTSAESQTTLYVAYSEYDTNSIYSGDPDFANGRPAKFRDLWLANSKGDGIDSYATWAKDHSIWFISTSVDIYTLSLESDTDNEYSNILNFDAAQIPTFYVKDSSGNPIIVLDYRDWWDIQIPKLIVNSLKEDDEYVNLFNSNFKDLWSSNSELIMDRFANIMVTCPNSSITGNAKYKNLMVIPSAINQNITADKEGNNKSINILNSWMINSYTSTCSNDSLSMGLRQSIVTKSGIELELLSGLKDKPNGVCAFGDSNSAIRGQGLFYYDTDSAAYTHYTQDMDNFMYGKVLSDTFDCDVTDESKRFSQPLKFELASHTSGKWGILEDDSTNENSFYNIWRTNMFATSSLVNANFYWSRYKKGKDDSTRRFLNEIVMTDGTRATIINDNAIAIPVKVLAKKSIGKDDACAIRTLFRYMYELYTGTKTSTISTAEFRKKLQSLHLNWDFATTLVTGAYTESIKSMVDDGLWQDMLKAYPALKNITNPSDRWVSIDAGDNETVNSNTSRVCVVYPCSELMRSCGEIFGVKDGTEFSVYCTYIYMTYLDFYGVSTSDTVASKAATTSKFSDDLYNILAGGDVSSTTLITNFAQVMNDYGADFGSIQDTQESVVQMSYLMLDVEKGRDYRKKLMYSGINDVLYEEYNRIVYGGHLIKGSKEYVGTASMSNSGFLSVENYTDNWLVSPFLDAYVDIAVWAIMICCILTVIVGLLKSKKISWFLISFVLVINVILLVPSSGEIVPYVTSSVVQKMFSPKMTYWSISEAVTNSSIEGDTYTRSGALAQMKDEDVHALQLLTQQLPSQYLDTSLSVKQDISQKITQKTGGVWSDIQSYQSARWILPMVMQQFTGDNMSEDYIYKPLSNIRTDLSNMYWYFNPNEARFVTAERATSTSYQSDTARTEFIGDNEYADDGNGNLSVPGFKLYEALSGKYIDYVKTKPSQEIEANTNVHFRCYSYTNKGDEAQVHLISSYLPSINIPVSRNNIFGDKNVSYKNADSWKAFIDTSKSNISSVSLWLTSKSDGLESIADSYDRTDRDTITKEMPYLLTTESPVYYFYNVVKDSLQDSGTVGSLISMLQGSTRTNGDGELIRDSFMHARVSTADYQDGNHSNSDLEEIVYTGKVRDVLDLEELFTNTIPYLYEVQIIAGGFDGKSGILSDEKIKDLQYYEGEYQSWLYRCNWATKLIENPGFSEPTTVTDSSGTKYTVTNPVLPDSYPDSRPMVFSEAQKYAMGLKDSDLSLVELKCIEVNEDVCKQWTLLINYAGTKGITKEILVRQMAIDATMIFSREFSSSGLLDTKYELYPQSLDLRYLSFDSMAKMVIMNVSQNTSCIYGDTMANVIEESSLGTSILLLLSAFLCAYLVPLFRTVIMAIIFYMGFISIARAIFESGKAKAKIACGQLVSNLVFMVYTLIYFELFNLLINITTSDEVLSVSKMKSSPGNPVWALLFIILISGLYCVVMWKHIVFCVKHFRDMGYEAMSFMTSTVVGAIRDKASDVGTNIKNFFSKTENNNNSSSSNSTSNTKSIRGTGIQNNKSQDVNINSGNGDSIRFTTENRSSDISLDENLSTSYRDVSEQPIESSVTSEQIDAEIDAGRDME